jgi:hypothetical protein
MQRNIVEPHGAFVIGVDAAGDTAEADRTVIARRKGMKFYPNEIYDGMTDTRLAGILGKIIDKENPDRVFLDRAAGAGAYHILVERGYGDIVELVNFGGGADDEAQYANKRAEMFDKLNDELETGTMDLPVDEAMKADILAIPQPIETSTGKMQFPPKKDIRKDYKKSTDIHDAMVLTYAYAVKSKDAQQYIQERNDKLKTGSELTTLTRIRSGNDETVNQYGNYNEKPKRLTDRWDR